MIHSEKREESELLQFWSLVWLEIKAKVDPPHVWGLQQVETVSGDFIWPGPCVWTSIWWNESEPTEIRKWIMNDWRETCFENTLLKHTLRFWTQVNIQREFPGLVDVQCFPRRLQYTDHTNEPLNKGRGNKHFHRCHFQDYRWRIYRRLSTITKLFIKVKKNGQKSTYADCLNSSWFFSPTDTKIRPTAHLAHIQE